MPLNYRVVTLKSLLFWHTPNSQDTFTNYSEKGHHVFKTPASLFSQGLTVNLSSFCLQSVLHEPAPGLSPPRSLPKSLRASLMPCWASRVCKGIIIQGQICLSIILQILQGQGPCSSARRVSSATHTEQELERRPVDLLMEPSQHLTKWLLDERAPVWPCLSLCLTCCLFLSISLYSLGKVHPILGWAHKRVSLVHLQGLKVGIPKSQTCPTV